MDGGRGEWKQLSEGSCGNLEKRGRWPEPRHWVENADKSTAPRTIQEIRLERKTVLDKKDKGCALKKFHPKES